MDVILDILKVKANPDYTLLLEFENGEKRLFDMLPYLEKKPFITLKNTALFCQATVDYGTVVWANNIDIAPETLYQHSKIISF